MEKEFVPYEESLELEAHRAYQKELQQHLKLQ